MTELPSKILESAAALTDEKLKISCELVKISYEKKIDLQEVIKSYKKTVRAIRNVAPPEQTTTDLKKHHKFIFLFSAIFIVSSVFSILYVFIVYGFGILGIISKIFS